MFDLMVKTPISDLSKEVLSNLLIHCVRGQSGFFDLVLTERNMQIKFDLRLSVYSLGVDI